jgi:malate synthase
MSVNRTISRTLKVFNSQSFGLFSQIRMSAIRCFSIAADVKLVAEDGNRENFGEILTPECLEFVRNLHRNFETGRQQLLANRVQRQALISSGEQPLNFLKETEHIRNGKWVIAPLPKALERRRVEITGPVDAKMVINALNCGADCYMADFEDSNTPSWSNQMIGQLNLKAAVRRHLIFKSDVGKEYKLNEKTATLMVRPRGWHLDEKHLTIDGQRMSGSLFDFGVFFYHNAKVLSSEGCGPFFYLPKIETHLEARLWNDVFTFAEKEMGLANGTIKATVLIETILAAFEMDEILYELREHSAGLNAGRWDYIFSCIKVFRNHKHLCFADRTHLTMTTPFLRAYSLNLVKTCHRRNVPAIGGMSALIPIKNDPTANEKALAGVREDKARDARDGFDGGWVAHPGLVQLAMEEFDKVLGIKPNQIHKQLPDVTINAKDLLNFKPNSPITENGLRLNIDVSLQYLASWLTGKRPPQHNTLHITEEAIF